MAVGWPLGTILTDIKIVELESKIVSSINKHNLNWECFFENTVGFMKINLVE